MAMERRAKAATETGIYIFILVAIVVGINVLSHGCGPIRGVYTRIDATRTERFTLSQGSGRLLGTLKQPMEVDVYVTRGLAKLDAFVDDLDDLLKEYERAGDGNFRYTLIEAKTEEQREAAKEAGLREAAFGEGSETGEDQASIKQGYMGIVFKYGSEKDVIPILSPERTDGLEFWITNKIREIRDKADDISHRIGLLTGKDEIKLSEENLIAGGQGRGGPSMKSIMQQALPFYTFEDVDLKGGETEIDEGLVGLLITQPGKDFTDKELQRIDQFVMRGRSLVVMAGAANLKASDATMKANLDLHGIDKLLTGYGIEMAKDVAMDWGRLMRIPMMTQSGNMSWVFLPGIAQVQYVPGVDEEQQMLDNSFAGFFRLEEIAFPYPSSLTLHPDKQPSAKLSVVARTSPRTTTASGESVELRPSTDFEPKPPFEQHAIAAVAEGKLKRAMEPADGIEIPETSSEDARVFVLASGQFLTNPFARAGKGPDLGPQFAMMGNVGGDEMLQAISQPYAQKYLTNTILVFKNTLDWMSGDSDLIAASAKILGEPNLTYSDIQPPNLSETASEEEIKAELEKVKQVRKKTQTRVQWTLTLLLPALFGLLGIAIWQMREKKRSTLTLD